MHVNSNLSTSIRHGPMDMGGLGIYDLRTEAGIEAIKFLRNSIFSDSEPGNLIRINLHYSQLESGVGTPLLEYPSLHLPYLTPTWVLSVCLFLSCHDMSITLTDSPFLLTLRSTSDEFLMQPTHFARYSVSQQRDINLVRLYLQATTLADLTNPENSSSSISLSALDGKRQDHWVNNPLWPRQETPSHSQCRLWKRFLLSSHLRYVPYWKSPPLPITLPSEPVAVSRPPPLESTHDYVRTLPTTQRRLLADLHQQASDVHVWRAFRSKAKLYIASDGGLHGNKGTHGWVLSSKTLVLFHCSGPVDGFASTESSTRSELASCASSLILVVAISKMWGGALTSESFLLDHRQQVSHIPCKKICVTRLSH